jgi:hypothetical protein
MMGRKRLDRSISEWDMFGDKFVDLVKGKDLKKSISNMIKELRAAGHDEQQVILQDLNNYKDETITKDVWIKWVKRINTAKDDTQKKKMDCSTEAAAIVDRIKIEFNFKSTIQAMDYVIKALPTDLRYLLHDFARKNINLLRETYHDLINSWEVESGKEFCWVIDYCESKTVPLDPSYDELLLTIIINFSERYVELENENAALKIKLNQLEKLSADNLKEWKVREADLFGFIESAWKDLLQWELLEECLINKSRKGSPKLLQSKPIKEGVSVIERQKPISYSYDSKLQVIEQLYKDLNLEIPDAMRNYRATFDK